VEGGFGSSIQHTMSSLAFSRVYGWHRGGGSRSAESCTAPWIPTRLSPVDFNFCEFRMERKCRLTILNCLINGPEFSTVDICSPEVHKHAALLVLLALPGRQHEKMSPYGAPLSLSS
jgi:hypothetical protein